MAAESLKSESCFSRKFYELFSGLLLNFAGLQWKLILGSKAAKWVNMCNMKAIQDLLEAYQREENRSTHKQGRHEINNVSKMTEIFYSGIKPVISKNIHQKGWNIRHREKLLKYLGKYECIQSSWSWSYLRAITSQSYISSRLHLHLKVTAIKLMMWPHNWAWLNYSR